MCSALQFLLLICLLAYVVPLRLVPSNGLTFANHVRMESIALYGKKGRSKEADIANKEAKRERRQRIQQQYLQQMAPISPMNVIQIAEAYRGRDIPEDVKRGLTSLESALLNDMSLFEATHPTDPFPAEFSERFRRMSEGGVWIENVDAWVEYFGELMTSENTRRSRLYFDDLARQHTCTVSSSVLEDCTFKSLRRGEINIGKVVHARLTQHIFQREGVILLMEDKEKTTLPLYLYNFLPLSVSTSQIRDIFTAGMPIIIKEPYLKCMTDGYLGLQVDNPCNLEVPLGATSIPKESTMDPFHHQESVENYFGPLTIGDAGYKGRGVLLTKDVEEGELLFREKAFAVRMNDRPENVAVNFKTNMYSDWSIIALIADLVVESTQNATVNNMLSVLSSERKSATFIPTFDMFLSYSFPKAPLISAYAIEGIITINAYQVSFGLKRGTGLWIAASFFNHDAFPNTIQNIEGKVMTLTAKRPMKAGTEVTVSYGSDSAVLRRKWGI